MMMACWSSCPQERPEFASLVEKLPKLLESDFSYVNIKAWDSNSVKGFTCVELMTYYSG